MFLAENSQKSWNFSEKEPKISEIWQKIGKHFMAEGGRRVFTPQIFKGGVFTHDVCEGGGKPLFYAKGRVFYTPPSPCAHLCAIVPTPPQT